MPAASKVVAPKEGPANSKLPQIPQADTISDRAFILVRMVRRTGYATSLSLPQSDNAAQYTWRTYRVSQTQQVNLSDLLNLDNRAFLLFSILCAG
jgi:hypothetical protein